MTFTDQTLSILAVTGVVLGLLALIVAVASVLSRRRRRGEARGPIQLDDALRAILDRQSAKIERLEQAVRALNAIDNRQQPLIEGSVRRVALLRYDAFEDVGGQLSFSCALLDEHGTGVVLTSINGRQETRVYAKPVAEGTSTYNLSFEEGEAIRRALASPERAVKAR
jgi:hypothetical protein